MLLLAFARSGSFEIDVSGWLGKDGAEAATGPELRKVPAAKSIPVRLRKMIAAAVAGDVPRQPSRPQRSEQPGPA